MTKRAHKARLEIILSHRASMPQKTLRHVKIALYLRVRMSQFFVYRCSFTPYQPIYPYYIYINHELKEATYEYSKKALHSGIRPHFRGLQFTDGSADH